jgi:hypothetical protein
LSAINAVSVGFMPDKQVQAGVSTQPPAQAAATDDATANASADNTASEPPPPQPAVSAQRNSYVDAYNVGLTSGGGMVRVQVPIP